MGVLPPPMWDRPPGQSHEDYIRDLKKHHLPHLHASHQTNARLMPRALWLGAALVVVVIALRLLFN